MNRNYYKYLVKILGEEKYLKAKYKFRTGKSLNLNDPKTFSEKLQWLKLYHRIPEMTLMADKILVKEFVSKRIGPEYVIELLKIYNSFHDLNLEDLPPTPFVIKTNHDSGGVKVILKKEDIDLKDLKEKFTRKNKNFYYINLEWEYLNINPKIFIEKHIKVDNNVLLQDFKVHCFNGNPQFIQTISDRRRGVKENWFNTSWEQQDMSYFSTDKARVDKPNVLDEMLKVSAQLAENLPYVRIDFYNNNGKLLFGEFTFRPYGGFMKWNREEIDYELGEMLYLGNL